MYKILRFRRGNTAVTSTFVGKSGEVTIDTSKNVIVVHDGITPGGWPQLSEANQFIPIASPTVLGGIKIGTGLNIDGNGVVTVNTASIGNLSIDNQTINGTVVDGNIEIAPDGNGRVILSGLVYPRTDGNVGQTLLTDGNGNLYWSTPSSVTFGDTAPVSPHNGDIWVDSNTGVEYIYYVDQDSGQWAEFGPTGTQSDNINLLSLNSSIIPASDSFYNLGSSSKRWRSLYVSGNTIYINDVPLTVDNNHNLLINGNIVGASGMNLNDLTVTISNTPSGSGNLSYNSGTGVFTFTRPDLSSFVTTGVLSSYPTTANVNSAINAASIAAQSAINTVNNAISAVSVVAANAISIANAASAAVNVVSNAVSIVSVAAANATSIANAASAAVNVVSNALSVEIANRISADAALSERINALSIPGGTASVTSVELMATSAALQSAINVVSNSVSIVSAAAANATSIANAASAAVNLVSNTLSVEIVNRASADNAVSAAALSALNTLSAAVAGQGYLKSNSLSVTTNTASGGGSLSYSSNVFTFTPPSNLTNGIYTASLGNTGNLTVSNDIITTGGNLRTTALTAYVFNATPTTVFIAGGATIGTTIGHASGAVTINGNLQASTNGFTIGYKDIPQLSYTGNTTLSSTDGGKHYYSTVSTATTLTVPNSTSVSFAIGTAVNVVNQGAGTITLAQGSGVTLYLAGNSTSGNRALSSYGVATIQKVATDTWFIMGVGLS